MDVPHFVYPFISWWTFGLLLLFDGYESCCFEHSCTSFCVNMFSFLLVAYLGVELMGHMVTLHQLSEEPPNCFSKWLHHFTILLAMHEGSYFFISLPTLVIVFFISATCVGLKWCLSCLCFKGKIYFLGLFNGIIQQRFIVHIYQECCARFYAGFRYESEDPAVGLILLSRNFPNVNKLALDLKSRALSSCLYLSWSPVPGVWGGWTRSPPRPQPVFLAHTVCNQGCSL